MKRIFLLAATLFCGVATYAQNVPQYHDADVEASKEYVEGNAYQKDLLLYVDMLGDTHPYYADTKHRAELSKCAKRLYRECGKIEDVAEFKLLVARLAASLNDGHTAIFYWTSPDKIFPVRVALGGGASAVVDACSQELGELLGREVVKINGKPLKQILKQAREIVSADNDVNFENLVEDYLMISEFWSMLGMSDEVLSLTFADGGSVDVKAINKRDLNITQLQADFSGRVTAPRRVLFDYTIYEEEGICYLQFNQFADRITHPKNPQLPRFDEFVRDMMSEIEVKGVKTLVVDLQYNGGGNSSLGNVLLSWLKPYAELEQYSADVRISELMQAYYPYYKEFTYDGKPLEVGRVYSAPEFDHNRRAAIGDIAPQQDSTRHVLNFDKERIFKGDVVFIQSKESFSSASLLLTTARDNGIGYIIGERSGGRPSHYGDILYCALPNTGTIATVSHKHFVRPNRALVDEQYLEPNIFVPLNNPDKDLAWECILDFFGPNKGKRVVTTTTKDDDSYLWDTIYRPTMN